MGYETRHDKIRRCVGDMAPFFENACRMMEVAKEEEGMQEYVFKSLIDSAFDEIQTASLFWEQFNRGEY